MAPSIVILALPNQSLMRKMLEVQEISLLIGQSDGGIFSVEFSFSQMTPTCVVELTKKISPTLVPCLTSIRVFGDLDYTSGQSFMIFPI